MDQDGKWLLCRLDGNWYGLDLGQVQEVVYRPSLIRLPTMGRAVAGMMEWLGREITVVNMGGGAGSAPDIGSKQVVVINESGSTIGLLVDEVGEIISKKLGSKIEMDPLLAKSIKAVNDAFEYEKEIVFALNLQELSAAIS